MIKPINGPTAFKPFPFMKSNLFLDDLIDSNLQISFFHTPMPRDCAALSTVNQAFLAIVFRILLIASLVSFHSDWSLKSCHHMIFCYLIYFNAFFFKFIQIVSSTLTTRIGICSGYLLHYPVKNNKVPWTRYLICQFFIKMELFYISGFSLPDQFREVDTFDPFSVITTGGNICSGLHACCSGQGPHVSRIPSGSAVLFPRNEFQGFFCAGYDRFHCALWFFLCVCDHDHTITILCANCNPQRFNFFFRYAVICNSSVWNIPPTPDFLARSENSVPRRLPGWISFPTNPENPGRFTAYTTHLLTLLKSLWMWYLQRPVWHQLSLPKPMLLFCWVPSLFR